MTTEPDERSIAPALRAFVVDRYLSSRQRPLAGDERLVSLGVIDSLGLVDLTVFVEETFDVLLTPDQFGAGRIDTLDELTSAIVRECRRRA